MTLSALPRPHTDTHIVGTSEGPHSTGVTSGLLRIYQAEKINAKFFIIAPQKELRRFQREVEKAPFKRIKEKYQFRSYEELRDMYLAAANFRKASDHFLGSERK